MIWIAKMYYECPNVAESDIKLMRELAKWRVDGGTGVQKRAFSVRDRVLFGKHQASKYGRRKFAVYLAGKSIGFIVESNMGGVSADLKLMKNMGWTEKACFPIYDRLDKIAMSVVRHLGLRAFPANEFMERIGIGFVNPNDQKTMTSRPYEWNYLRAPVHRRAFYALKRGFSLILSLRVRNPITVNGGLYGK